MECCDICDAPLFHAELIANPRYDLDLCDHCAAAIEDHEEAIA